MLAPRCAVICRDAGLYAVVPPRTAIAGLYVEVG